MRKYFRRFLPHHSSVSDNRWLAPFRDSLLHPRLWHLNRRSAAGGVAIGLICGLIPGPFQVAGSAVLSVLFKVNLPLAILCTFYTNPLTIVPLYVIAYEIGKWVLGAEGAFTAPPQFLNSEFSDWLTQLADWIYHLGAPIAVGLPLLGFGLALTGYAFVRLTWRCYLVQHIGKRRRTPSPSRSPSPSPPP